MALRKTNENDLWHDESVDVGSIRRLQRSLGLSDAELVHVLRLGPEATRTTVSRSLVSTRNTFQRLRDLESLDNRLQESFDAESARRWIRIKNRYLGDRPPIELLMMGQFDRVNAALEALDSGVFI